MLIWSWLSHVPTDPTRLIFILAPNIYMFHSSASSWIYMLMYLLTLEITYVLFLLTFAHFMFKHSYFCIYILRFLIFLVICLYTFHTSWPNVRDKMLVWFPILYTFHFHTIPDYCSCSTHKVIHEFTLAMDLPLTSFYMYHLPQSLNFMNFMLYPSIALPVFFMLYLKPGIWIWTHILLMVVYMFETMFYLNNFSNVILIILYTSLLTFIERISRKNAVERYKKQ